MTLDPKLVIWLLFSLSSLIILARMMDKRRAKLAQLLHSYVEARVQWTRKRAKATRLTQEVARRKGAEETSLADGGQTPNPTPGPLKSPL